MSDEYVTKVISHLEERLVAFYYDTMRRSLSRMLEDILLGRVNADVIASAAGAPGMDELTPVEWLEATPLMRRLRHRSR